MISLRARRAAIWLASLVLLGCTEQSPPAAPDPLAILAAIPNADSSKYEHVQDMKAWRNPYLIIRTDGVLLYDSADSAEIHLKTDELLPALAKLPPSYWPYGRIVAAQENGGRTSEQDAVAIRRNKGIVGGMLEGAHIVVRWVPTA